MAFVLFKDMLCCMKCVKSFIVKVSKSDQSLVCFVHHDYQTEKKVGLHDSGKVLIFSWKLRNKIAIFWGW